MTRAISVPRMIGAAICIAYLAVCFVSLDRYPTVSQDEPWIASSAYKLATTGTFGSDLFTGFHGMERHHFVQMPLYGLLEAAVFRLAGVSVTSMRTLPVLFGLAVLIAVYAVGAEAIGEAVGILAMGLLASVCLTSPTEVRPIGILLLDSARLNRYDIAVPAFGLAALAVTIRAARRRSNSLFAVAGVLSGLATLSHLYGIFWVPALMLVVVAIHGVHRATIKSSGIIFLSAFVTCLPWVAWVARDWSDYVAQMRTVSERLDVFNPHFYVTNSWSTSGPLSMRWLIDVLRVLPAARIGAWTAALGAPAAFALMLSLRHRRTLGETALLVVATLQVVCFIALIQAKSINYMIALWPLGAIALAWLACRLWNSRVVAIRLALLVLAAALAFEGGHRLADAAKASRTTSSYDAYERQIARCIPPGSRILGFQHYWLGLRAFDYRSWLLPFARANPMFESYPVPLDQAIDDIHPDIILIDRYAGQLFEETADPGHPYHDLWLGLERYRSRTTWQPRCVVRDVTYRTMEIWGVTERVATNAREQGPRRGLPVITRK